MTHNVLPLAVVLSLLVAAARAAPDSAMRPAAPDFAFGAYQRGDYVAAKGEAEKRLTANPKDAAALTLMGRLFLEGAGGPKDAKQALQWFRRAGDAGGREAAYLFGAAALAGKDIPKDLALGRAYLEKAGEHPAALNLLGELALENNGAAPDFEKALGFFKRAAALDDPDAAYSLALLYKTGRGVAKDEKEAANWLRRAVDQGHVAAMVELAISEFNGVGVARNQADAVSLLRRAAQNGNAVAQNRLARLLATGVGVERNLQDAAKWNELAKASGLVDDSLDALLKQGSTAGKAAAPSPGK